jgi:hypothetical protein
MEISDLTMKMGVLHKCSIPYSKSVAPIYTIIVRTDTLNKITNKI